MKPYGEADIHMYRQKVLLLNASNMETFPVYPYAFIQVPAVARHAGIKVICRDLLGIPQESWTQTIQTLIEQHDPVMILITLRNIDSGVLQDYEQGGLKNGSGRAYFPIERTGALITAIRAVSDIEIAVGGFGFSVLPDELMHYLHPDFGVFGGPAAFLLIFMPVVLALMAASGVDFGVEGSPVFMVLVMCTPIPLILIGIFCTYQGVVNAMRALSEKPIHYPLSIPFVK